VLDVGCATGVFLDLMRDCGWRTAGLDVSSYAVEASKAKGLEAIQRGINAAPWGPASFDLITLWDVIEHLEHPLAALRSCRSLLRPNGLLVISTPDVSAPLAHLLGSYWLGYRSAGEHLFFFGRKSLRDLLTRAGYEILSEQAVGKYMPLDYLSTRLGYYTRIFRWLRLGDLFSQLRRVIYINSGDTMCLVARRTATP
jgi:SAM-dependent methyltransferase